MNQMLLKTETGYIPQYLTKVHLTNVLTLSNNKVFGANTSAFSSRLSGFFICHPIYHENTMLLAKDTPSTLLLPAQRKQPHSCSSLPGIKR